jgi:hypothetical protein
MPLLLFIRSFPVFLEWVQETWVLDKAVIELRSRLFEDEKGTRAV